MDLKEKKLNSKLIYEGKVVTLYKDDVLCPNGNKSIREVVRHTKGACILCINDKNEVYVIKQYRYPYDDIIYELPAGKADEGEDPSITCVRELEEEAGLKALNIIPLGSMYPSCGYTDEIIYLYLCDKFVETKKHFDFDEALEGKFIPFEKLIEMIKNDTFKDAKGICAVARYMMIKNIK